MEIKNAQVVACNPKGAPRTWNGKTLYDWDIMMSNGDRGECSTTDPRNPYFTPGQLVAYVLDTSKPKYPKLRAPKRDELAQQPAYDPTPGPVHHQAAPQPTHHHQPVPQAAMQQPAHALPPIDKELAIIRESALRSAVEYHGGQEGMNTQADVLNTARLFEAWIIREERLNANTYTPTR